MEILLFIVGAAVFFFAVGWIFARAAIRVLRAVFVAPIEINVHIDNADAQTQIPPARPGRPAGNGFRVIDGDLNRDTEK